MPALSDCRSDSTDALPRLERRGEARKLTT